MRFEPIHEWDLSDIGEIACHFGDVDGDGRMEFIFPQAEDDPRRRSGTGGYNHEKTVSCLTCINLEGEILWQQGTPRPADRRKVHGNRYGCMHDFRGNGKTDYMVTTLNADKSAILLRRYNGATGELEAERETGACYHMMPADFSGKGHASDILINNALWIHFAYDFDLNPIFEWVYLYGGGHTPAVGDVLGTGKDQLFAGVGAYHPKGPDRRIWWRPDLEDAMEEMGNCPHVDAVHLEPLDDPDNPALIWVGGKDVVCLDPKTGETRWRHKGEHIQWREFGRFMPGRDDRQLIVSEKRPDGPTWLLAPDGEVLWEKTMGRGIFAPIPGAGPEGIDLLLDMTPVGGGFPRLINGRNETLDTFQFMGEVSADAARGVKGDAGSGFHAYCDDFDGDGLKELLMFNRHRGVIAKLVD